MTNIEENIVYYYLSEDPSIRFTLDEFIALEILAFSKVEEEETPLFTKHKSNIIGSFFVGFN